MIPESEACLHGMLAFLWRQGLMTRPDMSMKWCASATGMRILGGLWEREARNNPGISY